MATTRKQATDAIKSIEDKKGNKADKVRTTLTKILEYTETTPVSSHQGIPHVLNENGKESKIESINYFHYFSVKPLEDRRGATLFYSFKGLIRHSVNFTFNLVIKESNVNNPAFKIDPKLYETLLTLVDPSKELTFSVPLYNPDSKFPRTVVMRISFKTANQLGLTIDLGNDNRIINGDSIFTSVQFHLPKFNF